MRVKRPALSAAYVFARTVRRFCAPEKLDMHGPQRVLAFYRAIPPGTNVHVDLAPVGRFRFRGTRRKRRRAIWKLCEPVFKLFSRFDGKFSSRFECFDVRRECWTRYSDIQVLFRYSSEHFKLECRRREFSESSEFPKLVRVTVDAVN